MVRYVYTFIGLAFAACLYACSSSSEDVLDDMEKSDLSKYDGMEIVNHNESFGAEGGIIPLDLSGKEWSILEVNCAGVEANIDSTLNFKELCCKYDAVHVYGNVEFRANEDRLLMRVYPNSTPSDDGAVLPDGAFTPWGKSSPREIELSLKVDDKIHRYTISQGGVNDPSLYPFAADKDICTLPAGGGECVITMSTAYFWINGITIDDGTYVKCESNIFPLETESAAADWMKLERNGNILKITASPNSLSKERSLEISIECENYFGVVKVVQDAHAD